MADRLLIFDTETTGLNFENDQIIELALQWGMEGEPKIWRIRPDVPISEGSSAVHGVTASDVKDCPRFPEIASEVIPFFEAAEFLCGYNVAFDVRMLESEFRRIQARVDLSKKRLIDPLRLWQYCEPRGLKDAYARFVGSEFEDAHSAGADVIATGKVLSGMLKTFNPLGTDLADWRRLSDLIEPQQAEWVGLTSHLHWRDGALIFGFGKYRGKPVHEVVAKSPDYIEWIRTKDFPPLVIEVCTMALQATPEELHSHVRRLVEG